MNRDKKAKEGGGVTDSSEKGNGDGRRAGGDGVNRRDFLKIAGLAGATAGGVGLGAFGYAAGKDPNTYLGWQDQEGASVIFDRKRYEVDVPTYVKVGPTSRPDARVEQIFERRGRFGREYMQIRRGGRAPGLGGPPGSGQRPPSGDPDAAEAGRTGPVAPEDFSEPLRSYYQACLLYTSDAADDLLQV